MTDLAFLQRAIQQTKHFVSSKGQYILYDIHANECKIMVFLEPFWRNDCLVGCLVVLRPSEAKTLQEAFVFTQECACPHILVSSEAPHSINMISKEFATHFGFCSEALDVLSKALGLGEPVLQGWTTLFQAASEGRIARGSVSISLPYDAATCFPVVEAANGPIRHLLVLFGPQALAGPLSWHAAAEAVPITPSTPEIAAPLAILPRCRHGSLRAGLRRPPPVIITSAIVARLGDLPLKEAARILGVSPTAFKRACRKLGIRRWAYKRCRPSGLGRPSPSPAACPEGDGPPVWPAESTACQDAWQASCVRFGAAALESRGRVYSAEVEAADDADARWAEGAAGAGFPRQDDCDWVDLDGQDCGGCGRWCGRLASGSAVLDGAWLDAPAVVDDALVIEMLAQRWPDRL